LDSFPALPAERHALIEFFLSVPALPFGKIGRIEMAVAARAANLMRHRLQSSCNKCWRSKKRSQGYDSQKRSRHARLSLKLGVWAQMLLRKFFTDSLSRIHFSLRCTKGRSYARKLRSTDDILRRTSASIVCEYFVDPAQ
jgi:hypothetical protein